MRFSPFLTPGLKRALEALQAVERMRFQFRALGEVPPSIEVMAEERRRKGESVEALCARLVQEAVLRV